MLRYLKLLCIAAIALTSAVAVTSASAAKFTFSAHEAHVAALDNWEWNITGTKVNCANTLLEGFVVAPTTSVEAMTIRPTYTDCASTSGVNATVTGFGHYGESKTCDYVMHANGTVDLVCESGAEVTIHMATCVAHIPAQNGLGTVTYTNGSNDMNLDINLTNVRGVHTDGFLCPFEKGGESTSGGATGDGTMKASKPITFDPVSITWDA